MVNRSMKTPMKDLTGTAKMEQAITRTEDRVELLGRFDLGLKCKWASLVYGQLGDDSVAYKMVNPVCVELAGIVR
jgi:hypothetical protein